MMKTSVAIGIWAYMVASAVIEVGLFNVDKGAINTDIAIGIVAAAGAVVTALFSMGLREENTAVKYLFLIPVLLVAVLIITLVLSFPLIQ
jgi:multidrug transporter EmrE-like cation transporter